MTGGDIVAGAGLDTIGHQVLFTIGSFRFKLNTPLESVKGLKFFPVVKVRTGPVVRPEVTQFMFAVTAGSKLTVTTEPDEKL